MLGGAGFLSSTLGRTPKGNFIFQPLIFRGEPLVSRRVVGIAGCVISRDNDFHVS